MTDRALPHPVILPDCTHSGPVRRSVEAMRPYGREDTRRPAEGGASTRGLMHRTGHSTMAAALYGGGAERS